MHDLEHGPREPLIDYRNYFLIVILSLTTSAGVKRFLPTTLPRRLRFCRSAISLCREGVCVFDQSSVFSQSCGGRKVPPFISSGLAPKITRSNSRLLREAGCLFKRSASASRHRMTQACLHTALHSCA